ncbi:MAG: hypothetical protein ACKOCN_07905 [Planctomycetaceae bacterium]
MGRHLLIALAFIVFQGCQDKSDLTDSALKDSTSGSKVATTDARSDGRDGVALTDSMKALVRSLTFCTIAYEGSDAMEGSATPTLQNDGSIAGLNGLLNIASAVGAARIYGVSNATDGFTFTLRFDDGSNFRGTISHAYGSTAINVDLGKESQSLLCLDSPPEEAE